VATSFLSKAIVISRSEFGEADRYVEFYTQKWGVISALAKSAKKSKKRYVGGLDLFCHNEISLRGDPRVRTYLVELTVLNSFQGIRKDLDKLMLAGKLTQWIKKLTRDSAPMPRVYSLIGQTFALIERCEHREDLERLGLVFKIKLLSHLGIKPRLDVCTQCDSETLSPVVFDVAAGGILCTSCRSKAKDGHVIQSDERQFLDWANHSKLKSWDEKTLEEGKTKRLLHLISNFASYHTHVRLPS